MAKEEVNRARVFILGTEYTLRGNASVAHLRQVADKVDAVMEQVAKANPQLESRRVAVLAAINLADELIRLQNEYEELLALLDDQTAAATKESDGPGENR
ncbi:cell division protein ZapA [Alicyclobacillus kakegawensis]|uniref:cell division protein ZapA n=1 Tax=Alicyclobacillus kakegawensis TaxID=392012 RepID=UPI0008349ACA|nr:cell division protein ZapA [Alicyclobacillus kakegawensis]